MVAFHSFNKIYKISIDTENISKEVNIIFQKADIL